MYVTVHIVSRQPKNYQLNGLDGGESCGEVMIGLWILLLRAVIVIHCQLLGGGVLGSEYVHKSQTDPRFLGKYHEDLSMYQRHCSLCSLAFLYCTFF